MTAETIKNAVPIEPLEIRDGVVVYTVTAILDYARDHADKDTTGPVTWDDEVMYMRGWCHAVNAMYYGRFKNTFSVDEAIKLAGVAGKCCVVVEDLS